MQSISLSKFQFHKGTIRTTELRHKEAEFNNFNSIKVQLEPDGFIQMILLLVNFNSIKVQLELLVGILSMYKYL